MALCEPVTDMQRRGDFLEYVDLLHEVSLLTRLEVKILWEGSREISTRDCSACCSAMANELWQSVVMHQHAQQS